MELDELQVGHLRPRAQRQRDAVAGGHRRVGGLRRRPGRARRWRATTAGASAAPTPSCWPSPMTCSVMPWTPPGPVAQQVQGQGVLDERRSPDRRRSRRDERPEDLGAGRIAAGVGDPVAQVPALPGQGDARRTVAGRTGPRRRSGCAPPPGPGCTARARPPGRTAPRPRRACRARAGPGESPSASAAAMPPWAQRVEPSLHRGLGDHEHPVPQPADAQRQRRARRPRSR